MDNVTLFDVGELNKAGSIEVLQFTGSAIFLKITARMYVYYQLNFYDIFFVHFHQTNGKAEEGEKMQQPFDVGDIVYIFTAIHIFKM